MNQEVYQVICHLKKLSKDLSDPVTATDIKQLISEIITALEQIR